MSISIELLCLLAAIACLAGFIDTLAGGGGLLTLPAMLMAGLPPINAIATNKLQAVFGTATASFYLFKAKKIPLFNIKLLMLIAACSAGIGALLIQFVDTEVLAIVVPVALIVTLLYFLINPNFTKKQQGELSPWFAGFFVPLVGLYDGMLGPGTGSFFAASRQALSNCHLAVATATAKPLNFATNVAALIIFLFSGQLIWTVGLSMMVGQLVGARLGAAVLFKVPQTLLRWLIISMCSGMLLHYILSL